MSSDSGASSAKNLGRALLQLLDALWELWTAVFGLVCIIVGAVVILRWWMR